MAINPLGNKPSDGTFQVLEVFPEPLSEQREQLDCRWRWLSSDRAQLPGDTQSCFLRAAVSLEKLPQSSKICLHFPTAGIFLLPGLSSALPLQFVSFCGCWGGGFGLKGAFFLALLGALSCPVLVLLHKDCVLWIIRKRSGRLFRKFLAHKILEWFGLVWFGLEGASRTTPLHLPHDQVAPGPVQPGLKNSQGVFPKRFLTLLSLALWILPCPC